VRDAEVGDLRASLATNEDVARRDIAVNDAALMCGGEPARNLRRNSCSATWHKWADTSEHRGEIFAVNKLHDDCRSFTFWGYVEDCGNVRVRDDRGGAPFRAEARSGSG
jgi:hypothetical protein